jgi:hypothetical protein
MELTIEDIRLIGILASLGFDPVEFLSGDELTQSRLLQSVVASVLHIESSTSVETAFLKAILANFTRVEGAHAPIALVESEDKIDTTTEVQSPANIFFFTGH